MNIDFNAYQEMTTKTFKTHRPLTAEEAALIDWTLGLGGEVGEVTEIIKHHIFHEESLDKMKLAKEIGDVLWYLSALSKVCEIDLESIAKLNVSKLAHRHGQKYGHDTSAVRHDREELFESTEIYKALQRQIMGLEAE